MSIVYLNGEFLPLEQAHIPVLDRGFTFGDGVYEMLPVFSGVILRLEQHLQRLDASLTAIQIPNPRSQADWRNIFSELLERNPIGKDRSLYVQVTRGVGERDHLYKQDLVPTVFVLCRKLVECDLSEGVSAITHDDIRWDYCHIKATTLLAGVLLKMQAQQLDGSAEAILIRDGYVTEGASSNVFVIRNGVVKTPEKNGYVLPGITRDLVIELLNKNNISCIETQISHEELLESDEIWITSSTMGIAPVIRLDGRPVGDGNAGDIWREADNLYAEFRNNLSKTEINNNEEVLK